MLGKVVASAWAVLIGVVVASASFLAIPDSAAFAQAPATIDKNAEQAKDYEFPADPPPERFVPKEPLSVDEAKLVESRKLYMLGYMSLRKGQLDQAYETFKKVLEFDPGSLATLKEMVPLCIRLQKGEEGLEYCRKALKLDPENYALLQFFAQQMEEQGNIETAIDSLEIACKNPAVRTEDATTFLALRTKLADLYMKQRDFVGMARALRDVIEIAENPTKYSLDANTRRQLIQQKVRLYEQLGIALKGAKQYEEAITLLEQGMESQPNGPRLSHILAEIYYETGKYALALDRIEKYLTQTQSLEVYQLYETLMTKVGRQDQLLAALEELSTKDQYNPVLAQFYAEKLIEHKRFAEAESQLLQIKDRPEVSATLAKLYRETREPLKLLRTLAENLRDPKTVGQIRLIAQKPEFVEEIAQAAREKLPDDELRFTSDYVVALASSEADLVDTAKEFYERCISQRPELGLLYAELIELLSKHERYEELIEVASKAIEKIPQEYQFYDYKARSLGMLKRYDEAVKLVETLKSTSPDRDTLVNAELLLASVYQMQENWAKAAEICSKVIEENPDQQRIPFARYLLSNIYTLKGDLKEAEQQLLSLVESDPEAIGAGIRAAANNDLGYIWADEGKNLERAQKMIETALEINEQMRRPPSSAYLDSMGWVLFKRGEFAEAARYLKQATEIEPGQDAVIWDHLGDAYQQLNKQTEARKAWEKAADLYTKDRRESERPKADQVREKLRMLDSSAGQAPERATKETP